MKIVQSGEPAGEIVSLELLKKHVRNADDQGSYNDDDDDILTHYLAAATEWVRDVCQTVLLSTEFTATGDDFCLSFAGYPNPDIKSITFVDLLGAPGTITDYTITDSQLVVPNAPKVSSAKVVFQAGLGAGNVPEKLKQAILMLAAVFYDQGGETVPAGTRAMVAHHRSFAY